MKHTFQSHPFDGAIRDDSGKYRVYKTPQGIDLPSITNVLSKTKPTDSLDWWREREGEAAYHITELAKIYGTKTHKAIEETLNNKTPDLKSEMVRIHYNQLLPYINNINNIAGIELALYSDRLKVAGTADCIAEYNGILSVIDYKTKRKPQKEVWMEDYFIQTTAYSIMYEELTGIKISQIVILVSEEHGTIQDFVKDPNNYKEKLNERLELFYKN